MDYLYRFEFDEIYFINSFTLRADSFTHAVDQFKLCFDEYVFDHVISIHKII